MKKLTYILTVIISVSLLLSSCSENIFDIDPDGAVPADDVFESIETAEASLLGAYATLGAYSFGGLYDPIISDLMGEDIKLVEGSANYGWFKEVYQHAVLPSYNYVEDPWTAGYATIYGVNNIIVNAYKIKDADDDAIQRLEAEAKAVRAYCLLQLAHTYCDAYHLDPQVQGLMLPLRPAELSDEDLPRASLYDTYDRIVTDLLDAEADYLKDSVVVVDRSRLNLKAVQGILARAYLDMNEWEKASEYALKAVDHVDIALYPTSYKVSEALAGYGYAFMNSETLFAIDYTTETSNVFLTIPSFYLPILGYSSVRASDEFFKLFEDDDERYYYFFEQDPEDFDEDEIIDDENVMILKFGHYQSVGNADKIAMRASEMYLIAAEAQAQLNNVEKAQEYLMTVRLNSIVNAQESSNVGQDLIDEIYLERRKEFFGEGLRLTDIKRGQQTVVRDEMDHWVAFEKSPAHSEYYKFVFPLPQSEFDANKNISSGDQNPGYYN